MIPPIIDYSSRRPPRKRLAAGALTAAAWMVYAWLWVPLVTAAAWGLGVRTVFVRLYLDGNEVDAFLLLSLPVIALACAAALIGWAEYNRARFQKVERRRRRQDVDDQSVRRALGASESLAWKLRQGRVVHIALDDDAQPLAARSGR